MTDGKTELPDPLASWRALAAKVDAFFDRIMAQHASSMACGAGCVACCQAGLSVLPIEALAIAKEVQTLTHSQRAALREAATGDSSHCPYLRDNLCIIYRARPLVCRSHGLPIRQDQQVSVCELNFRDQEIPQAATMSGSLASTTLVIANELLLQKFGITAEAAERITLAEIASQGCDALPLPLAELVDKLWVESA